MNSRSEVLMKKWLYIAFWAFVLIACKDETKKEATQVDPVTLNALKPQLTADENESRDVTLLKAKVQSAMGSVSWLKNGRDKWDNLTVGKRVAEKDRIRTDEESQIQLRVSDGSVFIVAEKTEVRLDAEENTNGKMLVLVDITKGKLHFDVQKQKEREFKFKTGTATMAIRGTSGFVGNVGGRSVASLKEGRVEVVSAKGKKTDIVENQTVMVDSVGDVKVLKLKSSGTEALLQEIDSLTSDGGSAMNSALLEKTLKKFDNSYAASQKAFEKKLVFKATSVANALDVPEMTLQAQVTPGVIVTVWGESDTVGADGLYKRTFTWDESAYGTKRFLVSCADGTVEMPCYMWVTEYVQTLPQEVSEEKQEPEAPVENAEVKEQPKPKAKPKENAANNLNLSVKIAGAREERVHLDLPAKELSTKLKFSLAGISQNDLDEVSLIEILRNGKPFKKIASNDLTSLSYEESVSIERNKIADFEVVATLKNGKRIRAKKTFEVYCMVSNHPGGKARNSIVPPDQEYERLKQSGQLTHE